MGDPTFPLIPVIASIALLVTIAPLGYISIREHTGVVLFMVWQTINCIIVLVNSILWNGSSQDLAPVWCDFVSKIETGKNIGIPASGLCMMRGIYRVVQMDSHFDNERKKRQIMYQSIVIAMLLPIIGMGVDPLVATGRYVVFEDFGCSGSWEPNWPALVVFSITPMVITAITLFYCVLTLRKCLKMKRGRVFSGQSEHNRFLYARTLTCAWVTLVFLPSVCAYNLINLRTTHRGIKKYPGLNELGKHRKDVTVFPTSRFSTKWVAIEATYLTAFKHLFPSFTFFLIFGTGEVAARYYFRILSRIVVTLGFAGRLTRVVPEAEIEIEFAARPGSTVGDNSFS